MPDKTALIQDPAIWTVENVKRLEAYEQLIDSDRKRTEKFWSEKSNELAEKRGVWLAELNKSEKELMEVLPIYRSDIDQVPTYRAAYSDRTAALMAKLALMAYVSFEDSEKRKILEKMLEHAQFKLVDVLAVGETEAIIVEHDKLLAVAFRGTTSRDDLRTDLQSRFNVKTVPISYRTIEVNIHSGFKAAYDKIALPLQELLLKSEKKPIYLTGHSLGGALALVAAASLATYASLADRIAAIYTFGAPRVGQRNFTDLVKSPHYRIVNSGDIVPLVPPTWLRNYVHTGIPILLKEGVLKPIRRSPRGTAILYTLFSLTLWPFTRRLLFRRLHDSSVYVTRLDSIARHRGALT